MKRQRIATQFAKTIREKCAEMDITQADLADRLGISRQAFSGWLSRPERVTVEGLSRIGNEIGVDVCDLATLAQADA